MPITVSFSFGCWISLLVPLGMAWFVPLGILNDFAVANAPAIWTADCQS